MNTDPNLWRRSGGSRCATGCAGDCHQGDLPCPYRTEGDPPPPPRAHVALVVATLVIVLLSTVLMLARFGGFHG